MHMTLEADYAVRIVELFWRSRDVKPTLTPSRSQNPGFPCGSPLKNSENPGVPGYYCLL